MLRKYRGLTLLLLSFISACGLFDQNPPLNTDPVNKGTLLVIDEANQVMNSIDLNTDIPRFYSYVGPAANQILVEGDYAYLAVSSSHTILKMDLAQGGAPLTYSFYGAPNPYMMALDADRLYVTLAAGNELAVFDKVTMDLITNLSLSSGTYPQGVAVDSNRVYISTSLGYYGWTDPRNYSNSQILVLDKAGFTNITNITVHNNPHQLQLISNQIYFTATSQYNGTGKVQSLSTSDYSVGDLTLLAAVTPAYIKLDGSWIYVTDDNYTGNGGLYLWDTHTGITNHLLSGKGLKGIASDISNIYCSEAYGGNKVYIIRKSDYQITTLSNTGGGDMALYR